MSDYLLALDQGTSSSRALIFNARAELVALHAEALSSHYPQPAWVEQDPEALWQSQRRAMESALAKAGLTPQDIRAIGISNQRETVIAWDRISGEALAPAIVWQCRRSTPFCEKLKAEGFEPELRARTGLLADPYFSGTKMRWLLEEVPAVAAAAKQGRLAFGTVDSWLVWKLTGGRRHLTDASNASRTLLFNLAEAGWDPVMAERLGIPLASLPEVVDSSGLLAETEASVFGARIAIAGIAGDQQAALFGQACFAPGMAKNTYGTGCFLLMNRGHQPPIPPTGLLATVAWRRAGRTDYALEGSVFMAGALIQWLRDGLGILSSAADSEALAASVPDNEGVYIVPAFTGLGAPYWEPEARGLICGLTRGSGRGHLARAALEAVAYQTRDLLNAMCGDGASELTSLRIDGGMTVNRLLCQFQADIQNLVVSRPRQVECTALGAAFLAGLGVGLWRDTEQLSRLWQADAEFRPNMDGSERERLLTGWRDAVARTRCHGS